MNYSVTKRTLAFISGLVYLFLGYYVMTNPIKSLSTVVLVVGALILVTGIIALYDALQIPRAFEVRSTMIFDSILLMLLGVFMTFGNPFLTSTLVSYVLIFWFVATALLQLRFISFIKKTWLKVLLTIMNGLVIVLSLYTLTNPLLANSILALSLSYAFFITGVGRIMIGIFNYQ